MSSGVVPIPFGAAYLLASPERGGDLRYYPKSVVSRIRRDYNIPNARDNPTLIGPEQASGLAEEGLAES
jgi:hypothetical protein